MARMSAAARSITQRSYAPLYDFDQRHQRRRIESSEARARARPFFAAPAIAVTENDDVLVASSVSGPVSASSFLKHLALKLDLLRHGLDDQFAAGESLRALSDDENLPKTAASCSAVILPRSRLPLRKSFTRPKPAVDKLLGHVVDKRLVAGLRGDLRDSGAHRAGTENADFRFFVAHRSKFLVSGFKVGDRSLLAKLETRMLKLDYFPVNVGARFSINARTPSS
jgi:hypothetical protein